MSNGNIPVKPGKGPDVKSSGWSDFKSSLGEFWQEFSRVKYGKWGLVLLAIFILMIIFSSQITPFKEAGTRWSDIEYWEDNPQSAAPAWINWFSSQKRTEHEILRDPEWKVIDRGRMKTYSGSFTYNYQYDIPPDELIFKALSKGTVNMQVTLVRPDGEEIRMTQASVNSRKEQKVRAPMANDAMFGAYRLASRFESRENLEKINKNSINPIKVIFSRGQEGILINPSPLKGEYKVKIEGVAIGKDSYIKEPSLIVAGKVYGILGTDNAKRDIWSGIVVGTKWAMLIGLMTSFISVSVGVIYGVTSAYFGGWVDSAMMRVFEVFVSIPMLPVLIVVSAIFKPSIWLIILMMCIFYWTGPVRTVRSMGLQIKEETYIEAAKALNASNSRIIFKHMIPQLIPYAFASMALSVPGAIVVEASLSLLGVGDTTIVTWGQILHGAHVNGAVLQGLWWWVIPPGLAIALMGMTFAFIGFSMDKILNPKLKTR
ncbi:ABC transporter permease [Halothermothrix orenii]|uniref:Binding-protein-dependent transport systems inner membrane component n=1 Tax=Halothermothrix orenii (strain H 168 / OCM 544 / DSM 9562) TaxID=373903 RepID=B8CXN7_HALOH|nr:ABC transporter permease [Halothermothrix orenii]ACL70056.1 binding-protein-dependent transport systems inner membrane component [Halothermothrix orenii H 168]